MINLTPLRDAIRDFARLSPEEIGALYQGFALRRLAPLVAGTYAAGYITGKFIHDLNDRLPRILRFLGVNR
jgi:hypothetical protein